MQGLVYEGRPTGRLTPQKLEFARSASEADRAPSGSSLLEAVQRLRPSALIGAAAKQGAFSADTIKALTQVGLNASIVAWLRHAWDQCTMLQQVPAAGVVPFHVAALTVWVLLAWERQATPALQLWLSVAAMHVPAGCWPSNWNGGLCRSSCCIPRHH